MDRAAARAGRAGNPDDARVSRQALNRDPFADQGGACISVTGVTPKPGEADRGELGAGGKVRMMLVVSREDPEAPRALCLSVVLVCLGPPHPGDLFPSTKMNMDLQMIGSDCEP